MVNEQVQKGGYGLREICVRINSLDTPWGESDLRLIASCGCNAIAIPKVERADQVQHSDFLLFQILQVNRILNELGANPQIVCFHLFG